MVAQILAREADVPSFLGDVDLHHAPQQRVDRLAAMAQTVTLGVVDRLLAAEHEQEEQLGERPADAGDPPRADRSSQAETTAPRDPCASTSSRNINECCASSITSWYA